MIQRLHLPVAERLPEDEGRTGTPRRDGGVSAPEEPLSQNLFPIEFSRNCLSDMEKRESYGRLEWPVSELR